MSKFSDKEINLAIDVLNDYYRQIFENRDILKNCKFKTILSLCKKMTFLSRNMTSPVVDEPDDKFLTNKNCIKKDSKTKKCYFCKEMTDSLHHFYDTMCNTCGDINFNKRDVKLDLTGKTAIVTGGRIKIGFYTALSLLNNGANVIITTRFPQDALVRFQSLPNWKDIRRNLEIYSVDFTRLSDIKNFCANVKLKYKKIDYLINNAAQTIKRPTEFYQTLIEGENKPKLITDSNSKLIKQDIPNNALVKCKQNNELFPIGEVDEHGQQLDLRETNSWVLKLDEVPDDEMLEVMLINNFAPYFLNKELKPLMKKSVNEYSWIINVSSMEGNFSRRYKTVFHPHTNMAKAALNMMTRTCGRDYIEDNIVMVSVDTGWNTVENPVSYHLKSPLDCIDGASRILDPIYRNLTQPGIFYKDFVKTDW